MLSGRKETKPIRTPDQLLLRERKPQTIGSLKLYVHQSFSSKPNHFTPQYKRSCTNTQSAAVIQAAALWVGLPGLGPPSCTWTQPKGLPTHKFKGADLQLYPATQIQTKRWLIAVLFPPLSLRLTNEIDSHVLQTQVWGRNKWIII